MTTLIVKGVALVRPHGSTHKTSGDKALWKCLAPARLLSDLWLANREWDMTYVEEYTRSGTESVSLNAPLGCLFPISL